ncbi:hypothetical protein SteCoe_1173 [Stentor coeruleus]|uniref:DUF4378 domain-containing protein n=1 Tax=Stentor coeruleus TaxID=5963 RepID=A0A1R2D2D9_9CILI|nr:hypothetical protein SteCoe_1173 [Stentor coeruleus]
MQRTQPKDSFRSPSITPPNCTGKQGTSCKKKPPAHHKNKQSEVITHIKTSNKSSHQKKKSNKSRANSITPKTLKHGIIDRVFHNSNLSETDISGKYIDLTRPSSKINKSLLNRLELTQKVKDIKKSSHLVIEHIIKKSLNKAKQRKLSQEKENKEHELEKEIRRQELNLQNKQIRMQNSLKFKKKKTKGKRQLENSNTSMGYNGKVRSESSSKVRNHTGSLLIDPDMRNKRSISIGDYYVTGVERKSDPAILEYIESQNQKRKDLNGFEKLKQRAAEISKAHRLKGLEGFSKISKAKSPKCLRYDDEDLSESLEESESCRVDDINVKQNISFIEDQESDNSLDQEPFEMDIQISEGKNLGPFIDSDSENMENGRNNLIGLYSEQENIEDMRNNAAITIQRAFRKSLIHRFFKDQNKVCSFYRCESFHYIPQAKNMKTDINIAKIMIKPIQKPNKNTTSTYCSEKLLVNPQEKPVLSVQSHLSGQILIRPIIKTIKLGISKQYTFTIFPDKVPNKDQNSLQDLLQEQISWNYAQIYIIEQLRSEEISLVSSLNIPNTEKIVEKINFKFKNLLTALRNSVENTTVDVLENLSVEEFSKYEKGKQEKQEILHRVLLEHTEEEKGDFKLNLELIRMESNDVGVQQSSDMSSDDGENRLGISHSRSLSQLHGDLNQGKYISTSQFKDPSVPSKFPIFFDIEDNIEVQSINLLANELGEEAPKRNLPSLPSLPMLHLDIMQNDMIYSEPRILTSTDSIVEFIKSILSTINLQQIFQELKKPLKKSLTDELFKLQEKIVGTPSETKIYEFPCLIDPNELIDAEIESGDIETTLRQINKADKVHKKMLINVLNYLIQQFRPYNYFGEPLPWSEKTRDPKKFITIPKAVEKIIKDFETLSSFQIGRIFNEEIITSNGGIDEGLINGLREDRLEKLIFYEIIEEEHEWIDYEFEETQIKFDISDMILEELADEVRVLLG